METIMKIFKFGLDFLMIILGKISNKMRHIFLFSQQIVSVSFAIYLRRAQIAYIVERITILCVSKATST